MWPKYHNHLWLDIVCNFYTILAGRNLCVGTVGNDDSLSLGPDDTQILHGAHRYQGRRNQ